VDSIDAPDPDLTGPPAQPAAAWLRQNGTSLVVIAAVVGLVCYYLQPLDVLLAGFGMSLIIFLHELGHFAAAKLCDVHVKTFSIGFGPALPFCSFRYGETTYKLAMIPLGGFVSMVGEGDDSNDVAADDPDADLPPDAPGGDTNPRSFKNKPVLQRMVIISAGVIMNIFLAAVCFVVTYLHGVEEKPGVIARVESGGAAWRAGIHTGSEILRLNGRDNPWFDDIKPVINSTSKGETVELDLEHRGTRTVLAVEPIRGEGLLFPILGVGPADKLALSGPRRAGAPVVEAGSPAALAKAADGGPGFLPGDTLVAMTDPDSPGQVTPFNPSLDGLPGPYFDYTRRMARLADKPVTIQVLRKADSSSGGGEREAVPITVAPAFRADLGLRMRMGPVVAVRRGSPAEAAGLRAEVRQADQVGTAGDTIVSVAVPEAGGKRLRFTTDPAELIAAEPNTRTEPLDPLRLPFELNKWADRSPGNRRVQLTVLRDADHTPQRTTLDLDWDPAYRHELPSGPMPGTPVAVNGLGLAYYVLTVVSRVEPNSPAAAAGLKPNDKVVQVKYQVRSPDGSDVPQRWDDVKPHHWAFVDAAVQARAPHGLTVRVERDGKVEPADFDLTGVPDPTWGQPDRGLILAVETRTQKAGSVGEALQMGMHRTGRAITTTYHNLYATVFGRISVKALSGPITLARASYFIAGEDIWHLLLWMALISVNLAVVNFMPVPVLDGGHMVFLTYEAIRGKPAPVSVQVILTYVGLAMVGTLMLFVLGLDVWRLFF